MASDAAASGGKKTKTMKGIEELTNAGHRALTEQRHSYAVTCFKDALKSAKQLQDSRVVRACTYNLGAAYVESGQPQKGLEFLRRAQSGPKAERLPDLQFNFALAHNALGQSTEAAAHFLQAAQLYRSQGDGGSEGDACMEMGHCYSRTQDWSLAVQGFLRAAESYKMADMLHSAAAALKQAGNHMIQSQQFSSDDITGVLDECLSLTHGISEPRILGELYLSVGVSFCRLRCFPQALQCFQNAVSPAAQWPPLLAKVTHNLGAALNSVGQFKSALVYHRQAAGLYGSLGCRGDQARCFSNLAVACSELGDEEGAAESFIHALQGFTDAEEHLSQVQVCVSLAKFYLRQKKHHKVVQLYKQALSAASHCEDTTIRDQLLDQLMTSLQRLNLQRPRPGRMRPKGFPVELKSDIIDSPGSETNQEQDENREERSEEDAPGGQEAAERYEKPGGGASGDAGVDRQKSNSNSKTSLVQQTEAPPNSHTELTHATSLVGRLRSRFCSLM
ncbi:tetratricopeptide repeat protein 24 [Cynoglossus semilaevis]|uniref:tetratricopeptide repeat protein 24 n=1 Tax=Cynoglossus semilaevis TaxID=244447 RepID=UPI000D62C93F|nr:tetratricopeptide repeat protein 24 [Cynoglossus semilaevis]XP_024917303.1 tetratricopeptide repeat protein 24 [Cynoglossus semilaevis]XP_024917304.1 tetratricopeptide repeat protein 24 [Cynoglossus semilaevis]